MSAVHNELATTKLSRGEYLQKMLSPFVHSWHGLHERTTSLINWVKEKKERVALAIVAAVAVGVLAVDLGNIYFDKPSSPTSQAAAAPLPLKFPTMFPTLPISPTATLPPPTEFGNGGNGNGNGDNDPPKKLIIPTPPSPTVTPFPKPISPTISPRPEPTATKIATATTTPTAGEQAVQEISRMRVFDNIFPWLIQNIDNPTFFPELHGVTWRVENGKVKIGADENTRGIFSYETPLYNARSPFGIIVNFDARSHVQTGPPSWPGSAPGIIIKKRTGFNNYPNSHIWVNNYIDAAGNRVFRLEFTAQNANRSLLGQNSVDLLANGAKPASKLGLLFTKDSGNDGTIFTLLDMTTSSLLYRANLFDVVGDGAGRHRLFPDGQLSPNGDFSMSVYTSANGFIVLSDLRVLGQNVSKK